ncbi:MAG: hypothetical protein BWY19_00971 [bacterium ADurb.Bin212]|nr:MAG: hypothetical protein BWY19_00971 [bacterium ADurb.Bin212]
MLHTIKVAVREVKECFIDDKTNYYLVIISIVLALLAYTIWKVLSTNSFFSFYSPYSIYPLQSYFLVGVVNIVIAFFLYKVDKGLSRFMTGSLTFLIFIVIVLEIYYWVGL